MSESDSVKSWVGRGKALRRKKKKLFFYAMTSVLRGAIEGKSLDAARMEIKIHSFLLALGCVGAELGTSALTCKRNKTFPSLYWY